MRGKLALFFAYLTLFTLILALATPWFKWENHSGFQPNGGGRALCWVDATCRTNSDTNTLIFKGGYRAQRFYDATLMLLVIPAVLFFLPLLFSLHALNVRSTANSVFSGVCSRVLILLFGIIAFLSWIAAVVVFSQGIEHRYVACDFQSNIPQWGCLGPLAPEPVDSQELGELYGSKNLIFPTLIEILNPDGTRNVTSGFTQQHVEWAVLSGWYFAMLAPLFLLPTILCGLIMKNNRSKVVTQTTTTKNEQGFIAPGVGRAPVVGAVPVVAAAAATAPGARNGGGYAAPTTGYAAPTSGYANTAPTTGLGTTGANTGYTGTNPVTTTGATRSDVINRTV